MTSYGEIKNKLNLNVIAQCSIHLKNKLFKNFDKGKPGFQYFTITPRKSTSKTLTNIPNILIMARCQVIFMQAGEILNINILFCLLKLGVSGGVANQKSRY